jgi:hypothetical protein
VHSSIILLILGEKGIGYFSSAAEYNKFIIKLGEITGRGVRTAILFYGLASRKVDFL